MRALLLGALLTSLLGGEASAQRRAPALRSANLPGEVLAQFVVDTSGFVELDSFNVLKSTHPLFTEAVRQTLSQLRYSPVEVGGRKVRQLIQTPFVFTAK